MELYLCRDEQQTGPYTEAEVRALLAANEISRACLAWREGVSAWLPLEQIVTLPARPAPPPIPKGLPPVPVRRAAPPTDANTRTRLWRLLNVPIAPWLEPGSIIRSAVGPKPGRVGAFITALTKNSAVRYLTGLALILAARIILHIIFSKSGR